jgi:hypothetical protein
MAVSLFGMVAYAQVGPTYEFNPATDFGYNCEEWCWLDPNSSFTITHAIYRPGVCPGFYDCFNVMILWPIIDVELFIEWEIEFYLAATRVQMHLASYYETFCCDISGQIGTNEPACIILEPAPQSGYSLTYMTWETPVAPGQTGYNCPMSWLYSLDGITFGPFDGGGEYLFFCVGRCYTDFWIRICVHPELHQAAGAYYTAAMLTICPVVI